MSWAGRCVPWRREIVRKESNEPLAKAPKKKSQGDNWHVTIYHPYHVGSEHTLGDSQSLGMGEGETWIRGP